MRNTKIAVGILAVLGLAVLATTLGMGIAFAADTPAPPAVGTKAPDFTLDSQAGKPVSLHGFRGKWVVLYFYPKDFTKGCTIEAHGFQEDLAKYQAQHVQIVGVSVDSTDSHKDFGDKEGLNFTLLSDAQHKVVAMYGSVQTVNGNEVAQRNTFILNPKGQIVKEFIKVNPTGHSKEVLAALDELRKGSAN